MYLNQIITCSIFFYLIITNLKVSLDDNIIEFSKLFFFYFYELFLDSRWYKRFLDRLFKSKYKNNFVIKRGFFILSLISIGNRTAMDMGTTIKEITLKEEKIK